MNSDILIKHFYDQIRIIRFGFYWSIPLGGFTIFFMNEKIFHLVCLEIHANQMWLHSISSLIGNSVGERGTLTRWWRIPIGMAGDVKGSEKLEVL